MKKLFTFCFVLFFWLLNPSLYSQTSPDYIFGNDLGNGWSWTTGTQGTASLGGSFKWQFQANADGDQLFKFGETSSPDDGQGFWYVGSGGDVQYPGSGNFGDKWTAYYHANMNNAGAFYFAVTNGTYYVIKAKKQAGDDADFAVFWNSAAPVTITSVTSFISNRTLYINVTLSGAKTAQEKVWVRYSKDNWATSSIVEANTNVTSNIWRAAISVNNGDNISYYAFTTLNLTSAPSESDADFYTINYNNNNGSNYTITITLGDPLSGDYYIPQGSHPRGFDKLSTAVKNLNENGVEGNVTFYITGNITEPNNIGLGVNISGYTVTIKPDADADRVITFTNSSDNPGPSGGFVIGVSDISSWANLVETNNIIIDGYATGGNTRRLKFETSSGANRLSSPIRIVGNSNNIQIKNLIIEHKGTAGSTTATAIYAIALTVRQGVNPPDNVVIENCEIISTALPSSQGIAITNSSTPITEFPTGIIFRNNKITAKTRGIFLNYAGNTDIYGNEIYVNQTTTGYLSYGIMGNLIGSSTNVTNIYNNKILQLSTANNNSGDYGIVGIWCGSKGTYNVYNNMITGFATTTTATNPSCKIESIRLNASAVTANVYYNTILMNDVTINPGTGTVTYQGFYISNGTNTIKNNIVITQEDDFKNHCIYRTGTSGSIVSDYNNFYRSGNNNAKIGYWNTTDRDDLNAWKTASGQDANSVSKNVTFVNAPAGDLHLSYSQHAGDVDLVATPISGITTDIDGDTRDGTYPYKGADELDVPAPVELVSFTANYSFNSVKLIWQTATEVNNYGWEIERSKVDEKTNKPSVWEKIGFVKGSGNSNSPKEYTFIDDKVLYGYYVYRLRQIDNDGSYSYSNEVRIMVGSKPQVYDVKSYPNPFNPQTTIRFDVPKASNVKLQVYDITGQLVTTLVDEYLEAGVYERVFDGSRLASGIYISVLQAEGVKVVRKMQLIK